MRNFLITGLSLFAVATLAHETGPTFDFKVLAASEAPVAGQPVTLTLALEDKASHRRLTAADLEIFHEKLIHLMAFDRGLTGYLHEHPVENGDGTWHVTLTFARPGHYKLWANVQRKGGGAVVHHHHHHEGGAEETAVTEIDVAGAGEPSVAPKALPVKLSGNAGLSVVRLYDPAKPTSTALHLLRDEMSMIGIGFSRTDGRQPDVRPYLGALAHLVITDLAGKRLLHVHPMEHDGQLMLHTEFPEAGDYKVFVQFVDGELRTVELALHVDSDF